MSVYGGTASNPYSFDQALGILNNYYAPQYALLQQQQASAAAGQNAANTGYGLNAQQTRSDLAHQMRGYEIDASNLQINGGALNRQQQVLDAGWGISQKQNGLAQQEIIRQRLAAGVQHQQNYAQALSQAIAGGAANAGGVRQDRAWDTALFKNQLQGFDFASMKQQNDFDALAQQYFNARGDLADQRAHLGNDVSALGNQKDAAQQNANIALAQNAANQAGSNANYAGQSAQNAYDQGQVGIGAVGAAIGSGAVPGTPQAMQQEMANLQTVLSSPAVFRNVGNTANPLGVTDAAWNTMLRLAVLQAGGVQGPQSMQNLANLINIMRMAQAQQPRSTSGSASSVGSSIM